MVWILNSIGFKVYDNTRSGALEEGPAWNRVLPCTVTKQDFVASCDTCISQHYVPLFNKSTHGSDLTVDFAV